VDIWLHEAVGNESGWSAWCLDSLGFATWAPTESEVLARLPTKFDEHRSWLGRHGIDSTALDSSIRIAERLRGDEVMFSHDAEPCEIRELDLAIQLLSASRKDLLATVSSLPSDALDWDPPYRSFADWATWRTVRAILAHVANTETHYYLPSLGHQPCSAPAKADGDWAQFLPEHRQETIRFLEGVRASSDRARVSRNGEEWSVRKVVRRLVRHELLHWKSIRRIGREYEWRHT
jgi:hypothetical protein